jgi:ubiquinone biosynthesis monooxygenase Coq7
MKIKRQYSLSDKICLGFDQFLRALTDNPKTTGRAYPAGKEKGGALSEKEAKHAAGLMRINHAGEICAQALYHGQALVSRRSEIGKQLQQAAVEEGDHLAWCSQRLVELGSHTSYLNPLWYLGSFCIGLTAGVAGDSWSLGFLAETEKQVVKHLQGHLKELPEQDERSIKILQQMQQDEEEHREEALKLGAAQLPRPVQVGMSWVSKLMVKTAYWV